MPWSSSGANPASTVRSKELPGDENLSQLPSFTNIFLWYVLKCFKHYKSVGKKIISSPNLLFSFWNTYTLFVVISLVISAGYISFSLIIDEYRHNVPCSGAGYFKQNQPNHTEMATPKCAHISDKYNTMFFIKFNYL